MKIERLKGKSFSSSSHGSMNRYSIPFTAWRSESDDEDGLPFVSDP